jgi:predicted AlkP superfamily pyrophosphatase or phosphodiesterase
MIAKELEDVIIEQKGDEEFIYPFYEKYCFSNIPSTVLKFFGIKCKNPILPPEVYEGMEVEGCNKIVLLLIDGFGYKQWLECYKNYDFFNLFSQKGIVSPITSVFPSTTAAAVTTINTGLTPQEHALPEYVLYFREVDRIIQPLPFTYLDESGQVKPLTDVSPRILRISRTIYQALKKAGIESFAFIDSSYAYGAYSTLAWKGSTIIPFINYSDLVVRLRKALEAKKGHAYFCLYIGDLDSIQHKYGPYTDEHHADVSVLSFLLKKELLEKIDRRVANETLLLITADHGQLNVSPQETIYLNRYRKLLNSFQKSERNKPILPTGSPRDVFLHIEEKVDEMCKFLSNKLKGKARVIETRDAVTSGLFGRGRPRKKFYERAGNVLVLPYKNYTIWYKFTKRKKFEFLGHHGGLSREEMLVPFGIAKLSELV